MIWYGEKVVRKQQREWSQLVARCGRYVEGYIRGAIMSNQGSVVPFEASKPGEYPFNWDGTLAKSIKYIVGEHPLQAVILSDAVDNKLNVGHHFSGEEEFGHWWDGWAWDFQTGKIVKVAPAHEVAPRPFMRRGLAECRAQIFSILSGGGDIAGEAA